MRPLQHTVQTAGSVSSIAEALAEARRTGRLLDDMALSSIAASSDGYAVQAEVAVLAGADIAGWKIALPPDGEVIAAPIFADGVSVSRKPCRSGRVSRMAWSARSRFGSTARCP